MTAITTRYYGPTETRGSRILAKFEGEKRAGSRVTVSYDCELNAQDNHDAAVLALAAKAGWAKADFTRGEWVRGYVYVLQMYGSRLEVRL